jgi:UDP-glucose 4-epimerase
MKIFVTGVAGYIGASFAFRMLENNNQVIGIDNFSNSTQDSISRLKTKFPDDFSFIEADIRNTEHLDKIFSENKDIKYFFHFAALKNVPESQLKPQLYLDNNVEGTRSLITAMKKNRFNTLIFSSSAAVYGEQDKQPISETSKPFPKSIYAKTKLECEQLLKDEYKNTKFNSISLRYFNPMGICKNSGIKSSFSGSLIGSLIKSARDPSYITTVYGSDYLTKDGTGERDYIHIEDIISGHIAAIKYIKKNKGSYAINLGTGKSYSVLEVIKNFEEILNKKINIEFGNRRDGDIAKSYANTSRANKELKWKAIYNLKEMCIDTWIEDN